MKVKYAKSYLRRWTCWKYKWAPGLRGFTVSLGRHLIMVTL